MILMGRDSSSLFHLVYMYIGDVDSTVELYISRWNISVYSQMRSTDVVGQYTYALGLQEPPPEDDSGLY